MSKMALTIWSNATYLTSNARATLRDGAHPHRVIFTDEHQERSEDDLLLDADIAFGQPKATAAMELPKLGWLHLTSAGYTAYDRQDLRDALAKRNAILTNSSSVYSEPCAQHVLAMMLALARQLPQALDQQRGDRAWSYSEIRGNSVLLTGQSVLILGYGAIARRLIELLQPFRMNIVAVRRRATGDEGVHVAAQSEVESLLPSADHIVNTLPANESTKNFLDARRLGAARRGAVIYNIGRGTTVDQQALLDHLTSGHLAAAYLDVTEPEPLPPDHPLWSLPNCFITPHTGGGHTDESERLVQHFLANLQRFLANEPLIDRIF